MKTILLSLGFLMLGSGAFSQNTYGFSNRFRSADFPTLHRVTNGVHITTLPRNITGSLRGYVEDISGDSLYIKFWPITSTYNSGSTTIINILDNDSTFAAPIPWTSRNNFDLGFRAWGLAPVTIPFRVRPRKNSDLEAEFLNAGFTFARVWGKTRFFKQQQIEPKHRYIGVGAFMAFSQLEVDSTNTHGNITEKKQVATFSYGANFMVSYQNVTLILALGFDNAAGSSGKHWEENNFKYGVRPWIGFGLGFEIMELSFKAKNKD